MNLDWERIRDEFPSLRGWTYLNTATYGQMPRSGARAMADHIAHRDELACSDFLSWFDDADRLRGSIARLINATPGDIAFTGVASASLAILLSGIEWKPGDQIITLLNEFPNNLYAPHFAGSGVTFVETGWDRFYDAITPRTRLVLMSMLNYSSGFRPPLEEVSPFLRKQGILLYVDGTQGVGALRFDAARIRPSMLAVHGYKWMLAPTGAGFMYIDPELRAALPPNIVGWRSHKAWREVDNLHHGRPEFKDTAEKYEGGMIPFALLYALEASVNLMLELGPDAIEMRVLSLADRLRQILRECGAEVADGDTPIVAGRFPRHDVSAIARELKARRVVVSARHGHLRVSPHFYNNDADLDRFETALRLLLSERRPAEPG
jgi:cysteine desulfurase/selenocysteine lyase